MFHVKHPPHILLVNPWITDFAAYNLWVRPLGLLYIGSILRQAGFRVSFVDCLDFPSKRNAYGDGRFHKVRVEKPLPLKSIPRYYSRYGMPDTLLLENLSSMEKPDVVCITSGMTYWYPGLLSTIELIKKSFNGVPVILGGIYATLCYDHAIKCSGADYVIPGRAEDRLLELICELTGFQLRTPNSELRTDFYPSFDLYPSLDYVCISTSRGCPFRCSYCASHFLTGEFERRDPLQVVDEIEYWTSRYPVNDIAFYDDALLVEPFENIIPALKEVIRRKINCNFHAPNGLHIREIDEEVAALLFHGGFKTIRLGLETSNEAVQIETGGKVDNQGFRGAVMNLKNAGYLSERIGVYIMAGLPGQRVEQVEETIAFVRENGAKPLLTEYSPTPHTLMFEKAKEVSSFDLEGEPLFQNNSIFPCHWEGFTPADFRRLKEDLINKG
jgi:radical SAM superfamily enzyme YgiQ (UPF0313 family)